MSDSDGESARADLDTGALRYVRMLTYTPILMALSYPILMGVNWAVYGGMQLTGVLAPIALVELFGGLLIVVFGPIPLGYFISEDKAELANRLDQVNQHHWITITVYTYASLGVYVVWYLFARWRKTRRYDPDDRSGADDRAAADDVATDGRTTSTADGTAAAGSGGGGRSPAPGSASADAVGEATSAAATRGARAVPERIPEAPDLTVAYDSLTERGQIGSGGHADVTRATAASGDGTVTLAVKVPRTSGTLHTDDVEGILAEAETWAKLDDHDHVVGVVDYGADPIPWIAMEYMDGGHLGERAGELDDAQALWTAIAVTKAVRHAHRRGVAHLDLKPENVLFRSVDGAWDVPKVSDWGLSKQLLEHSQSVEGLTPRYAAPEQFDADEYGSPDDMTDVYQLGAMFYEMFTGRPPFEGASAAVMRAVMEDEPTPPSAVADVPEGIDEVLLTAMAKRKADRYDDIVYLRDALQNAAESR